MLKSLLPLTCALSLVSFRLAAEDLVYAKDGSGVYGYKDTPRLPWCQWLVHDPDRPATKLVDPGKAGPPASIPADAVVLFNGQDLSRWEAPGDWKIPSGVQTQNQPRSAGAGRAWMPRAISQHLAAPAGTLTLAHNRLAWKCL